MGLTVEEIFGLPKKETPPEVDTQYLQQDVNVVDAEAAIKKLCIQKAIPHKAKAIFGPKNVKDLLEIVNDNDMLEIDSMVYRGDLTIADAFEYTLVLPEYDRLRKKLDQLARNMVAFLEGGAIRKAVRMSLPSIQNPKGVFVRNPEKPLGDLLQELSKLINSQMVEGQSYRNNRISSLHSLAVEYYSNAILSEMSKREYTDMDRDVIYKFFFEFWDNWRQTNENGNNFPGKIILDMNRHLAALLKNHLGNLKTLIDPKGSDLEGANDQRIEEENQLLFSEISNLARSKTVGFKRQVKGKAAIDIVAGKLATVQEFREQAICMVRIHFSLGKGSKYFMPLLVSNGDGSSSIKYFDNLNSHEFYLDRSTGELTHPLTHIPVASIFSKSDYLLLKNLVYNFLYNYLIGKYAVANKVVAKQTGVTCSEVTQVCPDLNIRAIVQSDTMGDQPVTELQPKVLEDDSISTWEQEWNDCKIALRSRSADFVVAKMEAMLKSKMPGKPWSKILVRQSGSHKTYQGPNGRRAGLAPHGGKGIDFGQIKTMLKVFELSPAEFASKF